MREKKIRQYFIDCCSVIMFAIGIYLTFIGIKYKGEAKDAFCMAAIAASGFVAFRVVDKVNLLLQRVFFLLVLSACALGLLCQGCIISGMKSSERMVEQSAKYVLILGNKLNNGEMSVLLKSRLDVGIGLHQEINAPIIVSGGNGGINGPQESDIMKQYLSNYMNEKDILVENRAQNTLQNFMYTKEMIGTENPIVVVTSDFHMFRAQLIASMLGFNEIYGECVKTKGELVVYYHLREVGAIIREFLLQQMQLNKGDTKYF